MPTSEFNDRLVYLDVLRGSGSADFADYLAEIKSLARAKPDDLAEFSYLDERA